MPLKESDPHSDWRGDGQGHSPPRTLGTFWRAVCQSGYQVLKYPRTRRCSYCPSKVVPLSPAR
jgi:hypothetical protein